MLTDGPSSNIDLLLNERVTTWEDFQSSGSGLQTGDLLFCSGDWRSSPLKIALCSHWTHVAMVVRRRDELMVVDARPRGGFREQRLSDFFVYRGDRPSVSTNRQARSFSGAIVAARPLAFAAEQQNAAESRLAPRAISRIEASVQGGFPAGYDHFAYWRIFVHWMSRAMTGWARTAPQSVGSRPRENWMKRSPHKVFSTTLVAVLLAEHQPFADEFASALSGNDYLLPSDIARRITLQALARLQ